MALSRKTLFLAALLVLSFVLSASSQSETEEAQVNADIEQAEQMDYFYEVDYDDGNSTNSTGCDGLGADYDECGDCGGDNSGCLGCDNIPNSGLKWDNCGECGGDDKCLTCDGLGGRYDACGLCNGDNSTCGGCDGRGSKYDDCGVCDGDNSTCHCVKYHGFRTEVLDYMLVQYNIDQILWKIQHIMDTLILTMEDLERYDGPADLGVMIQYLNDVCEGCLTEFSVVLDQFTFEVKQTIGLESVHSNFTLALPYEYKL